MTTENNVISLQMELTDVVSNVYNRIEGIIKKYGDSLGNFPTLPSYETIIKSPALLYKYYNMYLEIGDEILCVMMALSLVHTSLLDIRSTKVTKDLSNEYSLIISFKKFLDESIERLSPKRFDLIELKRQATDRVKLLQSISYQQ